MQNRIVGKQAKQPQSTMIEISPQSIKLSKGAAYDKN